MASNSSLVVVVWYCRPSAVSTSSYISSSNLKLQTSKYKIQLSSNNSCSYTSSSTIASNFSYLNACLNCSLLSNETALVLVMYVITLLLLVYIIILPNISKLQLLILVLVVVTY